MSPEDYRDEVVKRISECQTVINDLDSSPAWKVVIADMERQRKQIDDNWQNITDEKKLQKARELKLAVMHIVNLKQKYEEELASLQKELDNYDNPEKGIAKDYDNETITEEA